MLLPVGFLSPIQNENGMFTEKWPECGSLKHTSFFIWQVENKLFKASVLWINDSRIHQNMKIAQDDSTVKLGCNDSDVAFHSLHLKGYQSKLLFFLLKGGQCSSCGLLHCNDWRSPWWARHNGPQHDCICSDTIMISTNFNSYASLVIFFIILFCAVLFLKMKL